MRPEGNKEKANTVLDWASRLKNLLFLNLGDNALTFTFFLYRDDFTAEGNVKPTGRPCGDQVPEARTLENNILNQKEEIQDSEHKMALLSASS